METGSISLEHVTEALKDRDIHAWILKYSIRTENGQPLDFHDHRYLQDIYWDDAPNLVEMKAAQLGLSTMEIFRTLWKAYYHKLDIIYILPTATDIKDFAGGKVNRIVDNNEILQEWVKDKDSVEQKRVGGSTIYYRGSWNERQALMISADWLILDEFDRCKQEVLEQYESRLQHSKYGYKSIFSNPSAPEFGVHKYFLKTDQKKWHITHVCGQSYILDETCINYASERFECPLCHLEITDEERRLGFWQATAEGEAGWSGYWLPLWINPRMSARKIAEYKRGKSAEYFANFVAGTPYYGSGNKVTLETINRSIKDEVNDQSDRIIIGVDTGLPIHIVIGNKQGIFYYGTLSDPATGRDPYDDLRKLLNRWPRSIVVSDQGGDLIGIRKLKADYPGRVFLVWYRNDKKSTQIIEWGKDEEYWRIHADRNRLIQMVIDEFVDGRITLNAPQFGLSKAEREAEWHDYAVHWLNLYRVWETDDSAGLIDKTKGFVWERMGPDHWAHATCYWRIGMDRFSQTMAEIVQPPVGLGLRRAVITQPEGVILAHGQANL